MQEIYECHDAAHDFSAHCKRRLAELNLLSKANDYQPIIDNDDNDPVWAFAMQNFATNGVKMCVLT